jgi:hypothetical protein
MGWKHCVLSFVSAHPEMVAAVGLVWSQNGKEILLQSSILSHFLQIQINSLNANFRRMVSHILSQLFQTHRRTALPARM